MPVFWLFSVKIFILFCHIDYSYKKPKLEAAQPAGNRSASSTDMAGIVIAAGIDSESNLPVWDT